MNNKDKLENLIKELNRNQMKIRNCHFYDYNHIFDENETVKKNREIVKTKNEKIRESLKKIQNESDDIVNQINDLFYLYIKEIFNINDYEKIQILFKHAYDEKIRYGYNEILIYLESLADVFNKLYN